MRDDNTHVKAVETLETLPEPAATAVSDLLRLLEDLTGAELLGYAAFGGRLLGDPLFAAGAVETVAVVRKIDLDMFQALAREGPRFGKRGIRAPLVMTPQYIQDSCDTFPLELLEIKQTRTNLFGNDYFVELEFDASDVRLQCERDLKAMLINLRQGLLSAMGSNGPLLTLCKAAMAAMIRILRGLLFVTGAERPRFSSEILVAVKTRTGFPLPGLERGYHEASEMAMPDFALFYDDVQRLSEYADGLLKQS